MCIRIRLIAAAIALFAVVRLYLVFGCILAYSLSLARPSVSSPCRPVARPAVSFARVLVHPFVGNVSPIPVTYVMT